jgi:hypothetical protein
VKTCNTAPPLPPRFPIHCSLFASDVRSNLYFCLTSNTEPSPCADLTDCQNDAVHCGHLYTVINVSDCTPSCLPLRLPHAVDLPAVFQVRVAQCSDFRPQPTPILSLTIDATLSSRASGNSFKRRHSRRSASSSRSIDRTLRRQFQRRSTQNVGELSGFFPTVKTCISAPPLPLPFSIHCSPCALDVRSNVYFSFFVVVERDLRPDRHLALT